VGCGSGYLATAFARLNPSCTVYGVDYIPELVELSRANIAKGDEELLVSGRVQLAVADGWQGWAADAPFSVIHVGAAASRIPPDLLRQLKVFCSRVIVLFESLCASRFCRSTVVK